MAVVDDREKLVLLVAELEGGRTQDQGQEEYLGALTSADGGANDEINARMKSGRNEHHTLTLRIWRSNSFQLHVKLRLWKKPGTNYSALAVRILPHQQLVKLERFQMNCLRHITRQPAHTYQQGISSDEISGQCNTHTIESVLRARRLKWSQHVCEKRIQGRRARVRCFAWGPGGHFGETGILHVPASANLWTQTEEVKCQQKLTKGAGLTFLTVSCT